LSNKPSKKIQISKLAKVSHLPPLPPIPSKPFKSDLEKSRYHQKRILTQKFDNKGEKSYAQVSATNINEVFKIKEYFSNLLAKKIEEIHKTINKLRKEKPCINIITKEPSRYQIIIPMDNDNISKFMSSLSKHIVNINSSLKNIKSDMLANFV